MHLQECVFLPGSPDVVLVGNSTELELPAVVAAFDLGKKLCPHD